MGWRVVNNADCGKISTQFPYDNCLEPPTAFDLVVFLCVMRAIKNGGVLKGFLQSLVFAFVAIIFAAMPAHAEISCKNLLDPGKRTGSVTVSRWYYDDGYLLKANQPYVFSSYDTNETTLYILDKTTNAVIKQNLSSIQYTPTQDVIVYFQAYRSGSISGNFQLEVGTSATAYAPYNPLCATCDGVIQESPNLLTLPQEVQFLGVRPKEALAKTIPAGTKVTLSGCIDTEAATDPVVWFYGPDNAYNISLRIRHGCFSRTYVTAIDTEYFRFYSGGDAGQSAGFSATLTNAQLELGAAATAYHPYGYYCAPKITIATTGYNEEQFSAVRTALNNAIDTINGLVATTLNQAETIGTLATTRQNRPATGCPAGKQCLLVKNPSGADQWFEIFDPLYSFVTPLTRGASGTCSATRYYGDVELRKLTNNTEDVRVWQYANNEISADSRLRLLNQREWAAQWTDENDNSGIVYGESKCISTAAGTFPERLSRATTTAQQNALAMEYNEDFYASSQTWNTYSRCWCRATSVATQYGVYPINNSQWIAEYGHDNGANCANLCAINCADDFKTNADFRQALFN